jgi:hypothetical protein
VCAAFARRGGWAQDYGTLRTEGFGLRRRLYRRALMYKQLAMADEQ